MYCLPMKTFLGEAPQRGLRFEPTSVNAPDTLYQHSRDTRSPGKEARPGAGPDGGPGRSPTALSGWLSWRDLRPRCAQARAPFSKRQPREYLRRIRTGGWGTRTRGCGPDPEARGSADSEVSEASCSPRCPAAGRPVPTVGGRGHVTPRPDAARREGAWPPEQRVLGVAHRVSAGRGAGPGRR